jgi:hypothetical protein
MAEISFLAHKTSPLVTQPVQGPKQLVFLYLFVDIKLDRIKHDLLTV